MSGSDQNDVGGAADPIPYKILFVFIYFLVPEADYSELILTLGRQDQLVYIFKGLIKGQLVVLVLVGLEFGELSDEYFAEELADFESWVRGRYLRDHRRRPVPQQNIRQGAHQTQVLPRRELLAGP